MTLPFTAEQFFGLFADYNRTYGVAVLLWWLACLGGILLCRRDPRRLSRLLSYLLAALWAWNGVIYHAVLFTRINPAAWVFSGLFLTQAILFIRAGSDRSIEYFSAPAARRRVGFVLVIYAFAYPFLNLAAGHEYPGTPSFGVPCPTTILTIGLVLTAGPSPALSLSLIPMIWAMVGGSAAWLLNVQADYALLAAGVVLASVIASEHARPLRRADHSASSMPH